ncbi:MAG: hypothetical protein ABI629_09130 [bacterium]
MPHLRDDDAGSGGGELPQPSSATQSPAATPIPIRSFTNKPAKTTGAHVPYVGCRPSWCSSPGFGHRLVFRTLRRPLQG